MEKNVFKRLKIMLLTVLLLFSVVGCNQTEKTGGSDGDGDAAKTLRIAYWGSTLEDETIKRVAEKYTEKTGIKVETIYVPNTEYSAKMATWVTSGDVPDICYVFNTDIYKFADNGTWMELYEIMENDPDCSYEDFIPDAFFEYEPGKACARKIANEMYCLYYNKDLFDAAGVEYLPAKWEEALTWDEFVDVCKALTLDSNGNNAASPDFDPNNIVQYGFDFAKSAAVWGLIVENNVGRLFNEDGTKFMLNESEATEAIQKLADLINVHHVSPQPLTATASSLAAGSVQSLQSNAVAIVPDGQWSCLDMTAMDYNWDVAVFHKGDDADAPRSEERRVGKECV